MEPVGSHECGSHASDPTRLSRRTRRGTLDAANRLPGICRISHTHEQHDHWVTDDRRVKRWTMAQQFWDSASGHRTSRHLCYSQHCDRSDQLGLHRCHDQTAGGQSVRELEYRDISQQRLCRLRPTLFMKDRLRSDEGSSIGICSNWPRRQTV